MAGQPNQNHTIRAELARRRMRGAMRTFSRVRKRSKVRWLVLLFWLLVCFTVGAVGARWNLSEIPGWYRTLVHPWFNPPDSVFGPVWSLLYLLMAVAAWRITLKPPSRIRTLALLLFVVQLGLNLAWSWIFFRQHAIGVALVEILVLWDAIGATTVAFGRIAPGPRGSWPRTGLGSVLPHF